ncbi:MAG: nitrous oxide-stimulated promoter family protein [Paramuribaculum sp.]|nr:nitrous oxide-stimulated promoter family protein [Paramuribaculum sp.]
MTRTEREKQVVGQMIAVYCKKRHRSVGDDLCDDCRRLTEYACRRIDCCPKGTLKTSCRKCEIHCYDPASREQIREVMRYVGPRMILINPFSAIRHLLSELR